MGLLGKLFGGNSKVDVRSRFELLREAISGTMSEFHMARDRKTGETVGLKILDRDKTAQLEARFVGMKKPKEGEIAILFNHPRIVRTMEHGTTTEGEQYLVMEFLDGPGLNSLIVGRSPLLDGNRVTLIRQAAEALSAVHQAGYIHRDICPRNFVVAKDCQSLKLIDFGLTVPATAPFMQPGNRTGTPNYMAPESVRRRPTSQKLDVFSFGVTAYELCAFELPWPRKARVDEFGASKAAMAHGAQEPTELKKYCPKINARLEAMIMACLETSPEKRPASMEDVLKMIKGIEREDSPK